MADFKLTSDRAAAVSRTVYWDYDMSTCPKGTKVLLLGGGGVAAISHLPSKDSFYIAWHPLPKTGKPPPDHRDEEIVRLKAEIAKLHALLQDDWK